METVDTNVIYATEIMKSDFGKYSVPCRPARPGGLAKISASRIVYLQIHNTNHKP